MKRHGHGSVDGVMVRETKNNVISLPWAKSLKRLLNQVHILYTEEVGHLRAHFTSDAIDLNRIDDQNAVGDDTSPKSSVTTDIQDSRISSELILDVTVLGSSF